MHKSLSILIESLLILLRFAGPSVPITARVRSTPDKSAALIAASSVTRGGLELTFVHSFVDLVAAAGGDAQEAGVPGDARGDPEGHPRGGHPGGREDGPFPGQAGGGVDEGAQKCIVRVYRMVYGVPVVFGQRAVCLGLVAAAGWLWRRSARWRTHSAAGIRTHSLGF
eukprot:8194271-Pyramimonas_sp.AAC.1